VLGWALVLESESGSASELALASMENQCLCHLQMRASSLPRCRNLRRQDKYPAQAASARDHSVQIHAEPSKAPPLEYFLFTTRTIRGQITFPIEGFIGPIDLTA
jgi:hypothetical protein